MEKYSTSDFTCYGRKKNLSASCFIHKDSYVLDKTKVTIKVRLSLKYLMYRQMYD